MAHYSIEKRPRTDGTVCYRYIRDPAFGGNARVPNVRYVLGMLAEDDSAEMALVDLSVNDVVTHGSLRASAGRQTTLHDFSYVLP